MSGVALAKTPRNEKILDMCGDHDSATIAATIYREMGIYLTANAVNCVIDRGKRSHDPRALARKSRRGRRSLSPWNSRRGASKKNKTGSPKAPSPRDTVLADLWPADAPLPVTSLLFINTSQKNCKFPLRGSGLGLIVCGAVVAEKKSYCPACLERTILREEGGRTPAAAETRTVQKLRSDEEAATPRADACVEEPNPRSPPKSGAQTPPPPAPPVGLDGLDLAMQPPVPIRMPPRHRVLIPRPPQRTFYDRGQLSLFEDGVCVGYVDGGFSDWGGRAWLTASACRMGTSSPA